MKTFDDDMELRQLIKGIKLDKPAPDFSTRVMNRVFQERSLIEQVKAEPVLSKGFWIIVALFILLMAIMIGVAGSLPASEANSLLPEINSGEVMLGYRSFFERLGSLPASIAGITCAMSLLVFLDRFLSSKKTENVSAK